MNSGTVETVVDPLDNAPPFWSLEFHSTFLPAILVRQLRPRTQTFDSPFANHLPLEFAISVAVCAVILEIALPRAVAHGSIVGWTSAGIATAGLVMLMIQSISSAREDRISYAQFRPAVFLFFVVLGATGALFVGEVAYRSRAVAGGAVIIGLLIGYGAGIFAGLWIQRLGWIGIFLDVLAGCAIIGMVVVDLMLLVSPVA